ncbi:hypothetical protein K402DRAFT_403423 [Aulographum hederae CBS 113979]|uniref:Homeobox domain-containing protein n=1 Tax=Aulographum hederae CBS 113979 TaxID=1176131 RepID=A0A6G1H3E0_9PEZI|nr:hypothetical protein K402DRAFT_403423 [Aulographum hederae CBS 113979]
MLAISSGLNEKQVKTWFQNARSRTVQKSPMEAWISSGSEEEPASEEDITSALRFVDGNLPMPNIRLNHLSPSRAPSISEASSSAFSQCSDAVLHTPRRKGRKLYHNGTEWKNVATDTGAASSQLSSPSVYHPMCQNGTDVDSNPIITPEKETNTEKEDPATPFPCTFCRRRLSAKSWKRHEESQHLPQHYFICMANGPTVPSLVYDEDRCAFCGTEQPPGEHFLSCHRMQDCLDRELEARKYLRKDTLIQHLKHFHGKVPDDENIIQSWKVISSRSQQPWQCGFCEEVSPNWDARATHIAKHFREGLDMSSWDSNRLEPSKKRRRTRSPRSPKPSLGKISFEGLLIQLEEFKALVSSLRK